MCGWDACRRELCRRMCELVHAELAQNLGICRTIFSRHRPVGPVQASARGGAPTGDRRARIA